MHRFFDPLRFRNPEYQHAYIVFTGDKSIAGIHNQLQLGTFDYVQNIFARIYRKKGFVIQLDGFEAFLTELQEHSSVGKRITYGYLQEAVTPIEKHAFIFKKILQKTGAREAIALCYYLDTKEFFGLNLAAHRLGITSIDLQHGGQGHHHLAYGQFFKVPASGKYALLPTLFWCWDKFSAECINTWGAMERTQHRAVVINHPWLNYLKSTFIQTEQVKPVIVYSLQPFQTLVLPQVITAMRLLGPNFSWILRLHPNMHARINELKQLIANEKLDEVIHPLTFEPLSLPETLAIAKLHLSRTSGTTIESSLMGVTTLLLDKEGAAMYQSLISEGTAIDCATADGQALATVIQQHISDTA